MTRIADEYRTLGYLVTEAGISYAALERAVRELGVAPAYVENGAAFYDSEAVERIVQAAAGRKPAGRGRAKGGG